MPNDTVQRMNIALSTLAEQRDLRSGVEVAQILLNLLNANGVIDPEEVMMSFMNLPNSERYKNWFQTHPHFPSNSACFRLNDTSESVLEAKLYALKKKSKLFISGAVHFTPNFEDAEFTRNNPEMKVGIDFFLTPDNDSLLVVLSKDKALRVVELKDRLTNTQVEIFKAWAEAAQLPERETVHSLLWESFKLKSLNKKFYEKIANSFKELVTHLEASGKDSNDARIFANRLHGRLLFCWFLDKKDFINKEMEYFTVGELSSDDYYVQKLEPLFFDTLNTEQGDDRKKKNNSDQKTPYLNGGLFEQQYTDWREEGISFPAGFFTRLFEHFAEFNFTTDESTPEYEQIAIDPEMLGKIFENLLAEINVNDETNEQARKAKGAFYTPREIVSYMCTESIREYLYTATKANDKQKASIDILLDKSDADWAVMGTNSRRDVAPVEFREKIIAALDELKVLDPACGSGAYPMGILNLMLRLYERLDGRFDVYKTKLKIMENNIYGVDIEPLAIEISRIRSFLALVVEQDYIEKKPNGGIDTLPNLEFKFVCANTLIPLPDAALDEGGRYAEMLNLKKEYFKASPSKREKIEHKYEGLRQQGSMFNAELSSQLATYEPFSNNTSASFYDQRLMHDIESAFDIAIGNPPYVSTEKVKGELKDAYKKVYEKVHKSRVDIYTYFYQRGLELTKSETGLLCYITSNKWMRAGYGEPLRGYFANKNPLLLVDFAGFKVFDSATVDTNILLVKNSNAPGDPLKACHMREDYSAGDDLNQYVKMHAITLQDLGSNAWFIGSAAERSLKEKIEQNGVPLKDWDVSISYGIKTGFNEAFVIDQVKRDELIAVDPKSEEIIKPMLRGRDIKRYSYEFADKYIIITKFGSYKTLEKDYPAVYQHLKQYEEKLKQRGQCKGSRSGKQVSADFPGQHHWLELDNNPSQEYLDEFEKEKIMWKEMSSDPAFTYDGEAMYSNDTVRILTGNSSKFLVGLFNSKLFKYTFASFYAGGGLGGDGVRYKSVFMEKYPVVKPSASQKHEIEKLVDKILYKKEQNSEEDTSELENEIDELIMNLYNLTRDEKEIIRNS